MNYEKMDLSLYHLERNNNINCDEVGEIMIAVRKVIVALAAGDDYDKTFFPNEIKNKNPVFLEGYSRTQNQVTITMTSNYNCDLFGSDRLQTPFYVFLELLKLLKPINFEFIKKYNYLVKKSLLSFVEAFIKNSFCFVLNVYGRHGTEILSIDFNILKKAYDLLRESDALKPDWDTYKGTLVGININSDYFAFKPDDNYDIGLLTGKLSKALKKKQFSIPSNVNVIIREHKALDKLTGKFKKYRTLEKVEDISISESSKGKN